MINTYFFLDQLGSPGGLFAALLLGLLFGVALEQAGFGSSRRLAGIFYFRDLAVLKVMFTAVIVAMLALGYLRAAGVIGTENLYHVPTLLGPQILGGLLFGVGFVMSGWCPGTGAVGVASGRLDALVFLGGAGLGSIAFNEVYGVIQPVLTWGAGGVRFAYADLKLPAGVFALLFALVAVGAFWFAELVERRVVNTGQYLGTRFLKVFSVVLVSGAIGLIALDTPASPLPPAPPATPAAVGMAAVAGPDVLAAVAAGRDHFEPEELADRLLAGEPLTLVDVRTPEEFAAFHLPGARHLALEDLPAALEPERAGGPIVLYSNGMTHPAQARDALARLGFTNVYLLTDGLDGFLARCLKPVSLRGEPVPPALAAKINAWRAHFLAPPPPAPTTPPPADRVDTSGLSLPGVVTGEWLASQLGRPGLAVLEVRAQPAYNSGHLPGALRLDPESLRGTIGGLPSMLLPAPLLAAHFGELGLRPDDVIVIVWDKNLRDATLVGMACERLGHARYAILAGGYDQWRAAGRPVDTKLPAVTRTAYPVPAAPDAFTVSAAETLQAIGDGQTRILDVRPAEFFTGKKSVEARAGHLPGALNRPYTDDLDKTGDFLPLPELVRLYAGLLPTKDTPVLVHCRTGHQASQTWFLLVRRLGYTNVKWYDAGWTEWAARAELPVATP